MKTKLKICTEKKKYNRIHNTIFISIFYNIIAYFSVFESHGAKSCIAPQADVQCSCKIKKIKKTKQKNYKLQLISIACDYREQQQRKQTQKVVRVRRSIRTPICPKDFEIISIIIITIRNYKIDNSKLWECCHKKRSKVPFQFILLSVFGI